MLIEHHEVIEHAHHRALGIDRYLLVDRQTRRVVGAIYSKNAARFLGRRVIADQPKNSERNHRAKDAALRRHRSSPPGRTTRDRSRLVGRQNDSTPVTLRPWGRQAMYPDHPIIFPFG